MSIDLVLRLLARLLPPLARVRYIEEWRADLLGASRLDLQRRGVVLGALALVVRIDRDRPQHSGEPRGARPRRLARRGAGLLVAAAGVLAGLYLTGGNAPDPGAAPAGAGAAFFVAARVLAVAAVSAGALGVLLLIAAGAAARTWLARATLLTLPLGPALLALSITGRVSGPLPPLAGLVILLAGFVGGVVVLTGSPPLQLQLRTATRRRRVPVAIAGLAALLAVVVLGGVDLVVWNPSARVPTLELASIYAGMVERDGFNIAMNFGSVAFWAVFWSAAGIVLTVGALVGRQSMLTPRRIAILMLGLISAAVFFRFFAGFGIGMSLGDSFDTSGGDSSIVSALLAFVGQLALAGAALALGWAPRATTFVSHAAQ